MMLEVPKVGANTTCIGIPEEDRQYIFTKFFRAQNAKLVSTGSSGIGLYIAKQIMFSHQGSIWFETKEQQGTTFHILFPIRLLH